jgi:formylglycine-generating enzyme required for sulfatase activity
MAGNAWEWTRSLRGDAFYKPKFWYPYNPSDGREDLGILDDVPRVLRGGAFGGNVGVVRCATRSRFNPDLRYWGIGFRVVVLP